MKAIQKFQADDGTEFLTQHDAEAHERLCQEIRQLMDRLRPRPDLPGCGFENGAGYIRQVPSDFLFVQSSLARIAKRYFKGSTFDHHFEYSINATVPTGHTFIGRLIDDGCPRPVGRAWGRLMCVDSQFREWGQPYYTNHPEEAKDVDLTEGFTATKEKQHG